MSYLNFLRTLLISLFLVGTLVQLSSQHYYTQFTETYDILLNQGTCSSDELSDFCCLALGLDGFTITPDSLLIVLGQDWADNHNLWLINQTTGEWTTYFTLPPTNFPQRYLGLVSVGNGIFYTTISESNILVEFDVVNGTYIELGALGFPCEEMALFNGEIYSLWAGPNPTAYGHFGIRKIDIADPGNNELIVDLTGFTDGLIFGLTATNICNTMLIVHLHEELLYVNLVDGVITPACDIDVRAHHVTSLFEFEAPTICPIYLDLDEDDNSGAIEADYLAEEFNCLTGSVAVSDYDITLLYDALITEMTIQISGNIPDAPFEILISTGNTPNIDVAGSGTDMITLTNAGGAKSTDFKDALRLIRYDNIALPPTAGLRTVEVQFTTESGSMSNVATAFIQVNELPLVPLDLGPDQEACEGQSVTFDAGNPGADYEWSTGATSQNITVDDEGEYIVTVSDGINCPNQDTVELTLLPVVHVALEGQFQTCDNVPLTLTINTDSPFPLTVEISATPGNPFVFNNIIGNFTFNDLPTQESEYTITSVTPSQPACIEVTDPTQLVDVYPSYIHFFDVTICEGDSVWLGFYWETEPGVYENLFNTIEDCDSVVTTSISVAPAITIQLNGTTCDSAAAGVFFEFLNNPNGCDTIKQTTVSLLPSDTTYLSSSSCNLSGTGIFTQAMSNQAGCDSLIITTVSWTPPSDTTTIGQTTCDSSQIGVFQQLLLDQTGCDSLVITTIGISPADTTYVFGLSCDITMIGVSEVLYNNLLGCDSLVITTISAGQPDTTYLNATSCDSASLGVIVDHFISSDGCDSTIITTITYSASDSTFIQGASCNIEDVGVFIESFINRFGCDSIVTTTITLLPASETSLNSTTCEPNEAGVFIENLINQFGCDSIVTTTVALLPSDETFLSSTTCMSSETGIFTTSYLNHYGCDSIVTLTVTLVPADTTSFSFKTCDPSQVSTLETTYINQDGCDSLVIEQTTLHPLPQLQIEVTSDFNGYAISCFGETDGSASAEVTGIQPWTYLWTTGSADQSISGLSAGNYAVSVTDGNGCITSGEVMLFEPEEFSINFIVSQPDCFDHIDGSIIVEQSGGVEPIRYSIDGINYQSSSTFGSLAGGTYTITAIDANDCEVKEIIWINVPLMVNVELGDDQMILPGETAIINAIVNVPFDSLASISWSGLINPDCPNCLTQPVAPIITTTYSVTVTSLDGCQDEDAMTLFLENNIDIYVPNIFSPNGDNNNDRLIINAGNNVKEITSMIIFDRWGNAVFSAEHFQAIDISNSWDGRFRGSELNPGVFAYRMIVEFEDGRQEIKYGDITLVR